MAGPQSVPRTNASLMEDLASLVRLVRELSHAGKAEDIFEPALTALIEIIHVDRAAILLLDPDGVARFKAWRGLPDAYRADAEGHFPWKLDDRSPQPIVVNDVEQDASLAHMLHVFHREGIGALGFIPLIYRERLVGKFMLYFNQAHVFSTEEVELAQAIGYLVAFAIERARLYTAVEESDRRKDAFLATLAHELRNPLAPTSAALALLAQKPDDRATVEKTRQVLERNVSQIVRLVDDLLDVSRITRGVIELEKHPVELTSLIRHALASVQTLISAQHQSLTLALKPLWLEADPVRLEQILTNLIHNAAKYTPAGGHIWISTRALNDAVEVRIRDDGIGIDPAVLPRLFDLFVQVDQSLARTRGGLGIGLTIVRNLVELHGGKVNATSKGRGFGSEFTVVMPGRIEAPKPAEAPTRHHDQGPRHRVLVVDDNADAAATLALLLDAWGHDVSTAADGPAAIAAVAERHPDTVFLDLGLPGMTGYEVAAHLRASGEKDLRIIALSGYGQAEDINRAKAAGCDAHLAKPADLSALERLLA